MVTAFFFKLLFLGGGERSILSMKSFFGFVGETGEMGVSVFEEKNLYLKGVLMEEMEGMEVM